LEPAAFGGIVNTHPAIPIENIYYLFCYAWNRFEEAQSIPLGASASPDLPNLLARVLLHGARGLLRRGLDRNYLDCSEEIATVRGRIDLGGTVGLQSRSVRRLVCEFDELSPDLLHNQIIKASLRRLAKAQTVDAQLAHELALTARHMSAVSDIRLERSVFARVQLHRNNAYYDLILKVAELAFDCLLPDPSGGGYAFHDILRDEKKMARVFEDFIRNFYKSEQSEFSVLPLTIQWDAEPMITAGAARLPAMIVDIYLRSPSRRIIIDTKYYSKALQQSLFGTPSFHSGNLYQIYSYLKNATTDQAFASCEGMLLYPQVGQQLREKYLIGGHPITVATIDLALSWPSIASNLRALLKTNIEGETQKTS
jgi:5-methylcytosine-specific restriction enzyme subunit McrC